MPARNLPDFGAPPPVERMKAPEGFRGHDLTGKPYGRWKVLGYAGRDRHNRPVWWCRCECGTVRAVLGQGMVQGSSTSCGCYCHEVNDATKTRHGAARRGRHSREYAAWQNMISRCCHPSYVAFKHYGGRGIKVCDRWRDSFEAFLEDMGPRPSPDHSLDRFPDQDGNYEPGNVRWATRHEQRRNQRNNVMITYGGKTLCRNDWARELGIPLSTLQMRSERMGPEKAVEYSHKKLGLVSP